MKTVFADTFYFIALLNRDDEAHSKALRYIKTYKGRLTTTAWVLTETADAASSSDARKRFLSFYDDLTLNDQVDIIPATKSLFDKGIKLYRGRADKDWSLTDCISFVVMAEKKLADALTGDKHYEQAGFKALLK